LLPEWFVIEESDENCGFDAEKFWIAYFRSIGSRLLNLTIGGEGTLNFSHSEETKKKIGQSHRGKRLTDAHRAILRNRVVTPEQRARISSSLKGRGPGIETAKKISQTLKGRKRPDEVRAKISAGHKGKTLSAEHIAKVSESKRNKPICKRGHPRKPGTKCLQCQNIRAALYRAGSKVFKEE
jgi:hypothetical protein